MWTKDDQANRGMGILMVIGLLVLALLLAPGISLASGITLAKYGGIYGHPNTDGGLTLYWNPARLGWEPGFFVNMDSTIVRRVAQYDRAGTFDQLSQVFSSEDPQVLDDYMNNPQVRKDYESANTGLASNSIAAVLPYGAFGYASNVGKDFRLGLAFGLFPAFGGGGTWDKNINAPARLPGALDGPQRWASIASNFLVLHYTAGMAINLPRYGLGFGFTAAHVQAQLETTQARNANRSDALYNPRQVIEEGRIWFHGKDTTWAYTLSAALDLANIRAGLVYRLGHKVRLTGPVDIAFGVAEPQRTNAFVVFPFPDIVQAALGGQWGRLSLTAITDYTRWSIIENNDAKTVTPMGDIERLIIIPRKLRDTFSLRGLAEWRFSRRIDGGLTLGYDPSAVPNETMDPGFSDAAKIQVGVGARLRFRDGRLRIHTSLSHDLYQEVTTTNSIHQPQLNGTYRDSRTYLNLSLEARR